MFQMIKKDCKCENSCSNRCNLLGKVKDFDLNVLKNVLNQDYLKNILTEKNLLKGKLEIKKSISFIRRNEISEHFSEKNFWKVRRLF